ncbi:hypothetical protein GGR53DRAFT_253513 [Hypoxylon sp. FL1150]|nr:hypothetical protein GGR53DRAFT_253513 [Hypoxylon sp. FL1150]
MASGETKENRNRNPITALSSLHCTFTVLHFGNFLSLLRSSKLCCQIKEVGIAETNDIATNDSSVDFIIGLKSRSSLRNLSRLPKFPRFRIYRDEIQLPRKGDRIMTCRNEHGWRQRNEGHDLVRPSIMRLCVRKQDITHPECKPHGYLVAGFISCSW